MSRRAGTSKPSYVVRRRATASPDAQPQRWAARARSPSPDDPPVGVENGAARLPTHDRSRAASNARRRGGRESVGESLWPRWSRVAQSDISKHPRCVPIVTPGAGRERESRIGYLYDRRGWSGEYKRIPRNWRQWLRREACARSREGHAPVSGGGEALRRSGRSGGSGGRAGDTGSRGDADRDGGSSRATSLEMVEVHAAVERARRRKSSTG